MSDLRTIVVEIETDDDQAEYDLHGALGHLAETVASEVDGSYRIVVTEDRDVIFTSNG